jgi:carboxymethylenebutenolidase
MRIAKRIAAFVVTTLLALLIALAAWIVIDRARTDGRVEAITNVAIDGPDGNVLAYRADPPGEGPHPTVVMIHEFWGLRRDIAGKADALAQRGYVVVAPDTFRGVSVDAVPAAIWNVVATPQERVNADLRAVVDALAADPNVDPERIVVMGFCYGGGAALRYSLSDDRLAGTGVFYGTPIDDSARLADLPGPVLGVFGAEDRQIPVAEVRAFEDALAAAEVPHEIHLFDGVGHAFVGSIDEIRAGGPPGRAWDTFLEWLTETVSGG